MSWLNAAQTHRSRGALSQSYTAAAQAIDALSSSSSGGELASAVFAKAAVVALTGDLTTCRSMFNEIGVTLRHSLREEFRIELAEVEALVGDALEASRLLAEVGSRGPRALRPVRKAIDVLLAMRSGQPDEALHRLSEEPDYLYNVDPGHQSRMQAFKAVLLALLADPEALPSARGAMALAEKQNAGLWRELAGLALASQSRQLSGAISAMPTSLHCVISFAAELILSQLHTLQDDALMVVRDEAALRPQRWLDAIRHEATSRGSESRMSAARLLDDLGIATDVQLLRRIAREPRQSSLDRQLGKGLARRLAPRVDVQDLGRVSIRIGQQLVVGAAVRRKVLALLCYLLTRPRFAATREEVMEAMWPDMDPAAAVNSLNQSVYFLRRIFEPAYTEDTTAGYVHQDSDLLWLDTELINSQSSRCAALVSQWERAREPEAARALSDEYDGKFALDFSYDDWSVDYRDWLHVAYLRVIEAQIKQDIDEGNFDVGVAMTRRALEIDARHEVLELSLFRLLRNSGAHSAAAEQFARYAGVLRNDLGVDPPSLDSV